MPLQDPVSDKSQENDEVDFDESRPWQKIASLNTITFKDVIEENIMVENENEEDKLPEQLMDVANTILNISLGIKSVRSHKKDFKQLLGDASSLVVVFWQLYNESEIPSVMWPPPSLRSIINELVDTVYYIFKLMKRKSYKNAAKRILVGYFGLRDLGKFKKYQRRLICVASGFESEPNNINITELLEEVIRNQAQDQDEDEDEDSEHLEEPVEESVRKKEKAADQEGSTQRPRLRKGKAKQNNVEDSSEDERADVEENKTGKKKAGGGQPEAKPEPKRNKGTKKARRTSNSDEDSEAPESEDKDKGKRTRHQKSDEDVQEGTSRQGSRTRTTNAAQPKTKKAVNPVDDDEEQHHSAKRPVSDPVAPKRQSKKKKKPASTPQRKVEPAPVYPQYSISGFSFNNDSGNMANVNVGNIYNSTISDSGNDNSVNTFHGKRKPA